MIKYKLAILGVNQFSDLYPNVKYKILILKKIEKIFTKCFFYNLGDVTFYGTMKKKSFFKKLSMSLKIFYGTLRVIGCFIFNKEKNVYIVYPAFFIVLFFSLMPKSRRPVIFIDAFISLYDTIVNDRALIKTDTWKARLLFVLEKKVFLTADHILVDTSDNAAFYGRIFQIPFDKFHVVPLAIPELIMPDVGLNQEDGRKSNKFICLFVGSLVPLHGIEEILNAVKNLSHIPDIEFVIVGDGQQSALIEEFISEDKPVNLIWHKGVFPTDFIVNEIKRASLCLGVFGLGNKAARVVPYKLYYYAALGKAFVTQDNPCLREVMAEFGDIFFCDRYNNPLEKKIYELFKNPQALARCDAASARLHELKLSSHIAHQKLEKLLIKYAVDG
ncbi:MAG: glycosyltransferase [Pseudomonadales bacterium]|nr:glycosyltransferase [Pseudomonadales bacterium]